MLFSKQASKRRFGSKVGGAWWPAHPGKQVRKSSLFLACGLAYLSHALGQITNVTNDQAVPTPGAGHEYIGTLNETVNPSNGSLSVRLPIPVPVGRGLTLPLAFSYNSSGIIQMGSLVESEPGPGNSNETEYIGTVNVHGDMDHGFLEQGGWSLGLPWLSAEQINDPGNNTYGATCPISTGFVFTDSAATRHAMYLAFPNYIQCQSAGGTVPGYPVNMYTGAYDGSYAAWTGDASTSSTNDVQAMSFFVSSNDGTLYHFPYLYPAGGCGATRVNMDCNVPDYIEDRNGNEVRINTSSGSTNPLPINVIDTAGRPEISIPTFESSTGDQVSVSGFSQPFVVKWETIPYNFSIPASSGTPTPNCATVAAQSASGSMLVVQSIELPNGLSYQFQYDPNYGLLNKITYPSGAYVQYTWGPSNQPSDSIIYPQTSLNSVLPAGCIATYNAPVILQRTVSYDGQATAQNQSFTYGTTGFSSTQTGQWTGKTTGVMTTDAVRNESFQTQYAYTPMSVTTTPDTVSAVAAQVPVEKTIAYQDFDGTTLKTVTKYWTGSGNNPLLQEEDTKLPNGLTAGTVYKYDSYTNIVEKAEFDYVTSAPPFYNAGANTYNVAPTRTTDTTYQSFPGRTAFYPASPLPAVPIYDRGCRSVTYSGSTSGTRVAETDTAYDGGTAICGTPGNAAGAPVNNIVEYNASGTVEYTHDETNFGSGSSASRGNATTITRWLNTGTSPQTTFTYDETGQMLTSTAPCSASCSDMTGSNFTTQYSYTDNYAVGTPLGNTNTYVKTITDPLQHTQTFAYNYANGKVLSSIDNSGNVTGYKYNTQPSQCSTTDQLDRLTEIDYPDLGVTQYCYVDAVPSVTTNQLLSGSTWKTNTSTMDGLGHVIKTQLQVGGGVSDYTGIRYDGLGLVYQVWNPTHCDPSMGSGCNGESTWGITTYGYDALGRKISQANSDGTSSELWAYNADNTVTFQDENGNQWLHTTDGLGRLVAVQEPNGVSTAPSVETDYTYDANDNLTQVHQYGGVKGGTGQTEVKRTFSYDSLSRLICASNPESATNPQNLTNFTPVACPSSASSTYTSGTLGYTYDANGNVQTRTDARGVTATYGYDPLNRVASKSYSDNGNTPSVSFVYDSGVLGITNGNYVGRLAQAKTVSNNSVVYNYSTLGYDAVGRPLGYLECPAGSNCLSGPSTVVGANYQYDKAGNLTQVTSQGTIATNGTTVGGVNQRNYSYDTAGQLNTVTADARMVGAQDAGLVTLFNAPSYNAAGQLTTASLAMNPTTQQSAIGLTRTYDSRLRPLSESDTGQVGTPGTPATVTVSVTGTERSIGGAGTPTQATGTISLSYSGGQQAMQHAIPLFASSSITLPDGYRASFVASTNSALATANTLASVLNSVSSPVTAVVASGGSASAASVLLTTKATGADENGAITLSLVATQVKAAPANLSGGAGTTYDTGTVTANVNGTAVTTSYGQTSTPQSLAAALATAITGAGAGVTATSSPSGTITVTANQAGTVANGWPVSLSSATNQPKWFSSPSFSGTSGSLGGGTAGTLSPGTIYYYSIPSPPTANTGYAGNGNLLSFTDSVNGQWTQIGYDTLNRLKTATVAGTPSSTTLTWSYDPFGNRESQGPNGGTVSYPPGNNRISGFKYEASGNVTDDGSNQYVYDGEGRVCTVYNKTMTSYTSYAYDGLGNRVAKGGGANGLSCDNNLTVTSTFIVGPNGEQLDALNASGAAYSNVFANGQLLATYQFPTSNWTYTLNDWLGTKRFVANAAGAQAEYCTGLPFGDGLNCTGTGSDPSPQHFTGKERDTESGNDYFGARYYASSMGRFMSPDWSAKVQPVPYAKLDDPQSLNLYSYVRNNPLSRVDKDGHCSAPSVGKGQIGVCIDLYIHAKTINLVGQGDGRGPAANDPKATYREEIQLAIDPKSGSVSIVKSDPGVSKALGGLFSNKGSDETGLSTPTQDKNGTSHFTVNNEALNGLHDLPGAPKDSIKTTINMDVTSEGKVGIEGGVRTAYPSMEIYSYSPSGQSTTILQMQEHNPSDLANQNQQIPQVAPQ